jgi:hypothetical protein
MGRRDFRYWPEAAEVECPLSCRHERESRPVADMVERPSLTLIGLGLSARNSLTNSRYRTAAMRTLRSPNLGPREDARPSRRAA